MQTCFKLTLFLKCLGFLSSLFFILFLGPPIEDRAQQDESATTETSKKRMWTPDEVSAVEKTLKVFIESGKVPGKADCMDCIKASLHQLKTRTWRAVKYYVKNRITAVQRESAKRY